MSEMGDWIAQLQTSGMFTRPGNERVPDVPLAPDIGTPPVAPADPYGGAFAPQLPTEYQAPPWAGDPGVPAPLADFLRHYASGYSSGVTPEMYQYFGGDNMLQMLQKFDPNARWVDTDIGGGEGASSTMGRRLEYNQGLLPAGVGPGWMSPVSLNSDRLRDPRMQYFDPNYGWVTDPRNVYHKSEGIEKWAPAIAAAISMGGPAVGSALMGAGIGAGSTAAVTGGAYGLPAANIPMGGTPTWWTRALSKAPRAVGPVLSGAPSAPSTNPRPVVPRVAAPTGGTPPMFPDTYGFDPSAFNAGGNTARTASTNDSRLVANEFAADPYGFSKG